MFSTATVQIACQSSQTRKLVDRLTDDGPPRDAAGYWWSVFSASAEKVARHDNPGIGWVDQRDRRSASRELFLITLSSLQPREREGV
jgi:hypothetical protein